MECEQRRARTHVGGMAGFAEIGARLFWLLVKHGLKEGDYLLDIGCGCLRVGKYLIAYLERGHYAGIEKEAWVLNAGIHHEATPGLVADKQPLFEITDNYDFERFHQIFDVAFAGSILSHTYPDQAALMLENAAAVLKPGGRLHATYIQDGSELAGILKGPRGLPIVNGAITRQDGTYLNAGWAPEGVAYEPLWIGEAAARAGFDTDFHPGMGWIGMVDSRSGQRFVTMTRRTT